MAHATPRHALGVAAERLRPRLRPILQTAAAAVLAWLICGLTLPDDLPAFGSIAAVISLGASYGEHRQRAFQLVGGVVLGITVADILVRLVGAGPIQIGVLVAVAMCLATILHGGELVVAESAVSAILIVAIAPDADAAVLSYVRPLEAVIGGTVALLVSTFLFPFDPRLTAGRAAQALFAALGRTLERLAAALAGGDLAEAEAALRDARECDRLVHALDEELRTGLDTARRAPARWGSREPLARLSRSLDQLDFAVRDVRVLARHAQRRLRGGDATLVPLADPVRDLAQAVWELAGVADDPARAEGARRHAVSAAARATALEETGGVHAELLAQVRSVAVDLRRAADLAGDTHDDPELPTEELLTS